MIRAAEQSIDTQQMLDLNEEVSSSTMTLGESSKKNTVNEPHHASYLTMIKGVVQALNESEEADKSAILKSLAQHYHVGGNITKDNSHMCTTRREVHEEDGIEQVMSFCYGESSSDFSHHAANLFYFSAMIKAAEQSMSMQGMLDASGPFPSAGMPLHKLSEKKKKILDKKNPIPGPHHPTYLTMIKGAVLALNESKGASKPAILKYLAQHYQLGENLPKINSHLCMALRKALREGNIEQTTGHGASGSFKMSPTTSKKIRPKIAKRKAAKSALPKIKRVIKKRAVVAKTVKPKVVRKPIKKPKVKKAIKKKVIKKIVPVDGKLRVKKKRVVVKSKTPLAKKT
ncbi:unnamed protein product [Haemonchus placei]|uniref:H15 domain-containing protein n=1 Tax=Haemonchus placei TaxID=6290 RepID=A0A0N4W164_HAEPC|nr:unnamed protein product [Haemonchus placei]